MVLRDCSFEMINFLSLYSPRKEAQHNYTLFIVLINNYLIIFCSALY